MVTDDSQIRHTTMAEPKPMSAGVADKDNLIARLQGELAEAREHTDRTVKVSADLLIETQRELAGARESFQKYATHRSLCAYARDNDYECDCGLVDINTGLNCGLLEKTQENADE